MGGIGVSCTAYGAETVFPSVSGIAVLFLTAGAGMPVICIVIGPSLCKAVGNGADKAASITIRVAGFIVNVGSVILLLTTARAGIPMSLSVDC